MRRLTVHYNDMETLCQKNSSIYLELDKNGSFVVRRTRKPFSARGLDQRHEQLNKDERQIYYKSLENMLGNEYPCLCFFVYHSINVQFLLSICYQE